jgi:hypothetical protein
VRRASEISVHETFNRIEEFERGSDRALGLVFACLSALVASQQAWRGTAWWPYWTGVAAMFALVTWLAPGILTPLNRLWSRLALVLSKVTTPVLMALLFFGSVWPTGLVMRILRKDPLRLKWQRESESYWVERTPPGPPPESLKNQF